MLKRKVNKKIIISLASISIITPVILLSSCQSFKNQDNSKYYSTSQSSNLCLCHNLPIYQNHSGNFSKISASQLKEIFEQSYFKIKEQHSDLDSQKLIEIFKDDINEASEFKDFHELIKGKKFQEYFDFSILNISDLGSHKIQYRFYINNQKQIVLQYRILCLDRGDEKNTYIEDLRDIILDI